MSTGAAIGTTVVLVLVAGITAGFWLSVLMWIPMLLFGQMQDEERALVLVSTLATVIAAIAVFVFGRFALGLPWLAAAIAGVLVGVTSYARPT